jgi:hypothetical protein
MRKLWLAVAVLLTPLMASGGVWPLGKPKAYNLGSDPTIKSYHTLDEGLGFFRVDTYDKSASVLTLTFLSGSVKMLPDRDVDEAMACTTDEAVELKPSQSCALWGKDEKERREHHILISWTYEDKKGVRVVVVKVRRATLKISG